MSEFSLYHYNTTKYYKNKNIIVTGATGGIGSILTQILINLEANVGCIVKDKAKFDMYFSQFLANEKTSKKLKSFIIDFEVAGNISEEFEEIMTFFKGKLDNIFICHGRFDACDFVRTTSKDYRNSININTRSCFNLMSLAVPFLKISKGNVVIISSVESEIIYRGSFLNSLTKSMNDSLIRCSALELASWGIRVNGVAPSVTNTLYRKNVNSDFSEEENKLFLEDRGKFNLLGSKPIEPNEITDAMLFLGSDEASFITGEILKVDGGYSLNHDNNFKVDIRLNSDF